MQPRTRRRISRRTVDKTDNSGYEVSRLFVNPIDRVNLDEIVVDRNNQVRISSTPTPHPAIKHEAFPGSRMWDSSMPRTLVCLYREWRGSRGYSSWIGTGVASRRRDRRCRVTLNAARRGPCESRFCFSVLESMEFRPGLMTLFSQVPT